MKLLYYYPQFYRVKICSLLLIFILLLISCQKSDDTNQIYLGKQNTLREYETNEWRYEVNTTIPFITVPDSFYKKLSYDSIPITQGLVTNLLTSEKVNPYDIAAYNFTNPENIYVINIEGEQYNLEYDLKSIEENKEYTKSKYTGGGIWKEDSKELSMILNDTLKWIYVVKPLYVGSEWVRRSFHYKADGVNQMFQLECKVLGIELISVKAGEFSAYKVEVLNHWIDIPSESVSAYEYYVPDVGLVLEESDGTISEAIIPPLGEGNPTTSTFHQKFRKELINYSFVK
jgi:hypothetical protein